MSEKSPSLIRLDKMCMYNELTGHGRPLRRKSVDSNPLESHRRTTKRKRDGGSGTDDAAVSESTPAATPPVSLFDALSTDRRASAIALSGMGFPPEWCALALSHSQYHVDRAANWLLVDTNVALCTAHEKNFAHQQREWTAAQQREKEAAAGATSSSKSPLDVGSPGPSSSAIIDLDRVFSFSGQLGTVIGRATCRYEGHINSSSHSPRHSTVPSALVEFTDIDRSCACRCWVPICALEWDTEQMTRVMPDYARLHDMQFSVDAIGSGAVHPHAHAGKKVTQLMHRHLFARAPIDSDIAAAAAVDSQAQANTIFHLAADLNTATFMVFARRIALICIYLLSLPQTKSTPASSTSAGTSPAAAAATTLLSPRLFPLGPGAAFQPMELIANLSAATVCKLLKLASIDGSLTLRIDDDAAAQERRGVFESGQAASSAVPSTPGLASRNDLEADYSRIASSAGAAHDEGDGESSPPRAIDIWLVLSTLLHNPATVFSSPSRDHFVSLLLDDCKRSLTASSYFVRDIDTEHPYQSGVHESRQEVHLPNAASLLVTFDRRCNLNQSHGILAFYADRACREEIAVFAGSVDEFSHIVIPGDRFFYTFTSGSLRTKPYEFGFRFRVRPVAHRLVQERQILQPVGPALASAISMGVVTPQQYQQQVQAVGVQNATIIRGAAADDADSSSSLCFSLGWPLLLLLTDSAALIDLILSHHLSLELLQSLLRYLTVCRSPCKVLATRALTALCVRVKTPLPASMFEILLRVMEQLYESNTASGWGNSPFLIALVDLARMRPHAFKLTDADLFTIDSMDNRPANWFFLAVVRAESISKAICSSRRLPHIRCVERAYAEMADAEILRWCLKQPELCLKLHKQTRGWNSARRDWMVAINSFQTMSQAAAVLVQLKESLVADCFRWPTWTLGNAARDWEQLTRAAKTVADVARAYMSLEAALKWGDSFPEADRAFGDTWSSRRADWLAAMRGLASERVVPVSTSQEAYDARWTRDMDEALIRHWDQVTSKTARRLMSLTFRDIEPMTEEQIRECTATAGASGTATAAALRQVSVSQLRARFALLKMVSTEYMRVLPVVDLSFHACRWSLSGVVKSTSKSLIFHQSKMYLWRSMLGRLYSEERPQFVILNRHESSKRRSTVASRLKHSLFYQLYTHVGLLSDPSSLRRRGQAWMVKFVGEGGHDVGGMYNESLVEICNELQGERDRSEEDGGAKNESSTRVRSEGDAAAAAAVSDQPLLPLFRLCPNGHHGVGDNRSKYLPNPCATGPLVHSMFEFVGRLLGICCLDNNRALPLDLPSLIWKCMVGEDIGMDDLKAIDFHAWRMIHIMRDQERHGRDEAEANEVEVNEETFPYLFPDLTFSVEVEDENVLVGRTSHQRRIVDLRPRGRHIPVTFASRHDYARRLERFYLTRYNQQIKIMCKGVSTIVPFDALTSQNTIQPPPTALYACVCSRAWLTHLCVSLFSSRAVFTRSQLEVLVTGSPSIDIDLLREKTEYRGNLSANDAHVRLFWEVMQEMTQEQRKSFLQFVWGRNR